VSTQAVTPDFIPAEQPDFIPVQGLSPSTRAAIRNIPAFPEAPKGNAAVRFLKGAGKTYVGATLNAGPATSQDMLPAMSPAEEADFRAKNRTNADYFKNAWNALTGKAPNQNPSLSNIPINAFNEVIKQPIESAVEGIQNDPAEGSGSALMNLLLLRAGYKQMRGARAAEFGAPNPAEIVQPLTRNPQPQVKGLLPAAPIELGPSSAGPQSQEGLLPAASRLVRDAEGNVTRQYLTRPLASGEAPPQPSTPYDLRTALKIMRDRAQLETPQGTGEAEAQGVMDRMAEYAMTPWDVGGTVKATKIPAQVKARFDAARAAAEGEANAVPNDAPQFAYRTRNAGETGIMPRGKPQASLDPSRVSDYMEGRATAENHPQELVKVDLSKLDPSEYEVMPNGYVKFKSAVPEAFISKVVKPKAMMTEGSDLIRALQQMAAKRMSAKAGDD
jgi:hypothetical protein